MILLFHFCLDDTELVTYVAQMFMLLCLKAADHRTHISRLSYSCHFSLCS